MAEVTNPGNESPAVVQRALQDIDLNGGIDESVSEITMDWTKRLLVQKNLVNNGNGLEQRPCTQYLTTQPTGPAFRLQALDEGVGVVSGPDYLLYQLNEQTSAMVAKDKVPEFSLETHRLGTDNSGIPFYPDLTKGAVICGAAVLDKYHVVAYEASSFDSSAGGLPPGSYNPAVAYNRRPCTVIDVVDRLSNQVVASYFWRSTDSLQILAMVGVDGRYLHFYCRGWPSGAWGSASDPFMFVMDTNSLPASGDITSAVGSTLTKVSFGVGGVTNWELGAVAPVSGGSIGILNLNTHQGEIVLMKVSATGVILTMSSVPSYQYVTGMDIDGSGNIFLAGYDALAPAQLTLSGWWRGSYTGAPWSGTSSGGGSNGRNLAVGVAPATGQNRNGFTAASFNGTTQYLVNATDISNYVQTTKWSLNALVWFNALVAPAANIYDNPTIWNDAGNGRVGVVVNNAGVKAYAYNGSTYAIATSAAVPSTNAWHAVNVVYDAGFITVTVDGVAGTPVATGGAMSLLAGGIRVGENTSATAWFNGQIMDLAISGENEATAYQWMSYYHDRYDLLNPAYLRPDQQVLSLYMTDYVGSPTFAWTAKGSQGASGSRAMSGLASLPTGTSLNGHASADFNGTTQYSTDFNLIGDTNLISATKYRVSCLCEVDTLPAPAGIIYNDPAIVSIGVADFGIVINSAGIYMFHNDGSTRVTATNPIAPATGTKYIIDAIYDGTNMILYVNGVKGTPVAASSVVFGSASIYFGANWSAAAFMDGRIWDVRCAQSNLPGLTVDQNKAHYNARYGLAL